jgi:hypothetical protein
VTVQAGAGCPWTTASQVPWVTITSSAAGSGTQDIQFTVEPNASGAPRTGTITIAPPGQQALTFTINQGI